MPVKISKEEFISRSNLIHNNKYDYSKVEYVNSTTKVCIICPEHGEFWQLPKLHMSGAGCKKCAINKRNDLTRYTSETFITKAHEVHGDRYDYSKVKYISNHNIKVCIICHEHGEFWQTPKNHLHGSKCPFCGKNKNNKTDFIKKAKEIHGDKYDYSKVEYVNNVIPVCIICHKHGEFWQTPSNHLRSSGCSACGSEKRYDKIRMTKEEFIEKSREIHGSKYDYSKVEYMNIKTKVCIICSKHGEFWQTPKNHLHGSGCPKCKTSKLELNVMSFLEKNSIEYLYNKELEWTDKLRLDFYIPNKNIVIECQGVQHYEPRDFAGKGYNWAKKEFELIQERDKRKFELCSLNNKKIIYINNINEINDKLSWII